MNKCADCCGAVSASRTRQTQRVAGRQFTVTIAGATCRACGASFLENDSLQRADLEVACELARHGPPAGDAFRFLRKTLGMRGVDLAALLDVTPETISRWENGQRPVDRAAWLTVGSMVLERAARDPETLERMRALRLRGSGARAVHIDATRDASARGPTRTASKR
jgi:DNA-binding XRE family transcriptional regulator